MPNFLAFILLTTIAGLHDPFAPYELNPDNILLVHETPLAGSGSNYNQGIQIERGWNLVSWYVELPDETGWDWRWMDDVFREPPAQQGQPYGDYIWLNPILDPQNPDIGDRVGKYNSDPYSLNGLYPTGNTPATWTWSMNQAYHIYRDRLDAESLPHFWEYQNQVHTTPGSFNFNPSNTWDEYVMPGENPNYWYFLAYPLRMWQILDADQNGFSENPTIQGLEAQQNPPFNHMQVMKDDAGKVYIRGNWQRSTLRYLDPGKGYFIGFQTSDNVTCQGFTTDQEPASVPGGGPQSGNATPPQTSSLPAAHFTFKSRTHWWYPVVVDTADLGEILPASGDEIGVFDGELCVGAASYPDSFPMVINAWKDDISTEQEVDGYLADNPMTFIWYDQSANTEAELVLPPGIYASADDPVAPDHSGFGRGLYGRRSFANGTGALTQLPQKFRIGQNYPNPFNSQTIIPLELPQRSRVRVELFNVRGQSLGMMYEGIENAGWPKIHWNATQLPSGIYFYKVTAIGLERGGKYTDAKKLLMLK